MAHISIIGSGNMGQAAAPLTEGHSLGWPWWTWLLLAVAVAGGAVTYLVEKRAEGRGQVPLLPPSRKQARGLLE